ncbi:AAC(3) family N-acetyltransferase [Streptomyces sp. NPDC059785]|uniref:AAC(3) family N-acetyltransferase n=1 Tax=unclassified Streptomyces TaxID=2593676 RepID=UPI0036484050
MTSEALASITSDQILTTFRKVGVRTGDTVYVASSLAGFALLDSPVETVTTALRAAVGADGTLVMPSFHPGFRYAGFFDRELTPSKSGILSEAFRQAPGTRRTWDPPYNPVCVQGRAADAIARITSPTAFGPRSVFDHLIDIDATVLLIGCSFHDGVAHVHWLEERHDVPYRSWQRFTGDVVVDGECMERSWRCHVRRPGVELHAGVVGEVLESSGVVFEESIGLTRIAAFSLQNFVKVLDPWFARNKDAMVL